MNLAHRTAAVLDKQVFFVLGCQKSGTTWVQKLLDGHAQVCCDGEAYFGPLLQPLLGQALNAYHQRHKAGDAGNFNQQELRQLFAFACGLTFQRWINASGKSDVRAIGEKTPEHALCLGELDQCFPNCRVIHIIRDGRDVCVSGYFHNLRQGGDKFKARFPDFNSYIEYTVTRHWAPYIQQARAFGARYPQRYHEVRYEQLHADPRKEIGAMLRFIGVNADEQSVAACAEAGSFKTLTAGRERGQEDKQSFFRKGVVGDWKNHFDPSNTETFMRHGGTLLRELGYEE